ncbi:rRNA maturation RNase YbeY [Rhodopirellula sp.]|nr:rRNA maturation RNase YbeY [Rhodopirellula sp.]MDB4678809.1 rRNA maturation RNase YbeY [Rhodopirellula sp.]
MPPSTITVDVLIDPEIRCPLSFENIKRAVITAASDRGYRKGQIGLRVTDDVAIHQINREHLGHDYPTDVISFDYGSDDETIEGELVVSIDTAKQKAEEVGWDLSKELTLYIIHGTLHIAGLEDQSPLDRRTMRDAETRVLQTLGIQITEKSSPDFIAPSTRAETPDGPDAPKDEHCSSSTMNHASDDSSGVDASDENPLEAIPQTKTKTRGKAVDQDRSDFGRIP